MAPSTFAFFALRSRSPEPTKQTEARCDPGCGRYTISLMFKSVFFGSTSLKVRKASTDSGNFLSFDSFPFLTNSAIWTFESKPLSPESRRASRFFLKEFRVQGLFRRARRRFGAGLLCFEGSNLAWFANPKSDATPSEIREISTSKHEPKPSKGAP